MINNKYKNKLIEYSKKVKKINSYQDKIDIVYTWVNSEDKKWQNKIKQYVNKIDPVRFKQYDEIYFSLDTLEKSLDGKADVMKSLNDAKTRMDNKRASIRNQQTVNEPEPDESGSSTQMTRTGKAGFCYIGEDRGIRSCIQVGENDQCMSGDIFPSRDICVNPNLRI